MAQHTVHRFTRPISSSDTGVGIYGCEHPRCPATEKRRVGSPSPYGQKHQAKRAKKKGVPA